MPAPCPRVYLGQPGIHSPPALVWPPDATPTGFDPDLAMLFSEGLGCELRRVEAEGMPTELRWSLLENDEADLAIFQNSVTEERRARVDFTSPYAADGLGIVVPVASAAAAPEDLTRARIIVAAGTTAESWAQATFPEATLLRQTNDIQEIKACFADARCDALVGDHSSLSVGASRDPKLRLLPGGPYTREVWAVAVAKGKDDLRRRLDTLLSEAEATGRLGDLRARYGLSAP